MTNPEELQRRFSGPSRKSILLVFLAVVALVALAAFASRPAWTRIKAWRAAQFHASALRHLAADHLESASQAAQSALQLDPDNSDILRLNARLLSREGNEGGLVLWLRLLDTKTATLDDRASFVESALALERLDLVTPLIADFLTATPATPRSSRIAALYCTQSGRLPDAIRHARLAAQDPGFDPTNTVLLAGLLASQPRPEARAEARQLYWTVARTNNPFRLDAIRQLIGPRLGDRSDREQVVALLSSRTNRTPEETALVTEARMLLDPSQTAHLVSNLVARLPRDDVDQLRIVVDTLDRTGRYNEVLRLTGAGRSLQHRRLFEARLEALLATGQLEEAYRHTLSRDAPLPTFDLELARIRAADRIGDVRRRETHLRELLGAAGTHPGRLRTVAELAETTAAPNVASDAWRLLAGQPVEATNGLRRLQRLADRKGDTWTARDYARRALRLAPDDPELRLDVAHYSLLLGEDFDRALREAERQFPTRTNDFRGRAVLALAYLRLGSHDKARAVLDRVVVDDAGRQPSTLAILAAVFGSNGLAGRAEEIARQLPLAELRPEERELIRPWAVPTALDGTLPAPQKP